MLEKNKTWKVLYDSCNVVTARRNFNTRTVSGLNQ